MSNELSPKQRVLKVLEVNQFTDIDYLTDLLVEDGVWADRDPAEMIRACQKAETRTWLKTLKDERGRPAFANIEIEGEDGKSKHVYMQPKLFDVEQYKQVISYHVSRVKYHANEAKELQKDLKAKYDVQYKLPFKID